MPTLIRNWNGKEYSLDEILHFCDVSDGFEIPLDEAVDNDPSTSSTIVRNLVKRIKELEPQT